MSSSEQPEQAEHLEQSKTGDDIQDDIQIEVSDVRAGADGASFTSSASPTPMRSPFEPRYTRRQQLARTAAGVLILAIVIGSITGVGGRVFGLFAASTSTVTPISPPANVPNFPATFPPPASTVVPAANAFYLLPNPPGVVVSLDGRALTAPPLPGAPHPLQLAPGHHVLAWTSHYFPFGPLRCTLSAPHAGDDTCPLVNQQDLPAADANLAGHVIAMHVSLGALPASETPRLTQAIQGALNANVSEAIIQPGEHYFLYQQDQIGSPVTAMQPLRATLSYDYLPNAGYFEPCILTQPAIPCRFPGQDCSQICTVPQPPPGILTSPDDWIAAVEVHASWSYITLDGHVVAQDLGEAFGLQLAVLRLRWDGGSWSATLISGTTPGLPAAADLVCDPARFWVEGNGTWSFMVSDPPPGATATFISDSIPTDGCLAVLNQHPPGVVPAVFLQRFGVLVAVNATAENGGSAGLPVADAAERQQAEQLAAQAGISFS